MDVTVSTHDSSGSWRATARVEGAPDLDTHGFSYRGKQLRPERLFGRWDSGRSCWRLYDVKVYGSLLKKDGTPGQISADVTYSPSSLDQPLDRAPDYVREWVAEVEKALPELRD